MPGDLEMSQQLMGVAEQRMADLSDLLANGDIDLGTWQIRMRGELRDAHAMQVVAAAGGDKAKVSADDWLKLGSELKSQYAYLEDFAHQIKAGDVSLDAVASRSKLYARTSGVSYWKQVTDRIDLPAYPKDGTSECMANCGCQWQEQNGEWYWVRNLDDSCKTCVQREADWSPYQGAKAA